MNRAIHILKTEFEMVLAGLAALAVVLVLTVWVFGLGEEGTVSQPVERPPHETPLINPETAFRFLDSTDLPPLAETSPFHFLPKTTLPSPPRPPPPPPPPRSTSRPTPAPRPTPKPSMIFEYLGVMTTPSGRTLALVRDVKADRIHYLQAGDKLAEQFEVTAMSETEITFENTAGDTESIPFSQRKTFILQ